MRIQYITHLSILNLRNRKLRSFLTIGGMAIGIGAIVFLVSLGFGLQRLITSQVTNIDALTVLDVSTGSSALLKIDDTVITSFKSMPHVLDVSPSLSISGQASREGSVTDIAMYGINPSYTGLENVHPTVGGVFSDSKAAEAILSTTAGELLNVGDFQKALGQTVTFLLTAEVPVESDQAEAGAPPQTTTKTIELPVKIAGFVDDELTLAYLPLALLQVSQPDQEYNLARVKVDERDELAGVRKTIEGMGYQVDSIADTVGQIDQIFLVFEIVMAGFGLIAMFVASLGAFNTLTVSLLERTREVGIMKALGATSRDVYRLFLTESFLIGVIGGGTGLALGVGLGELVNVFINELARRFGGQAVDIFYTPILLVGMVFGVILVVSFVTGVYPARRASRLNPLNALRYE